MSRHNFETVTSDGINVFVVAGWDRPLQQYFLDVEVIPEVNTDTSKDADKPCQESEYLYESSTDMRTLRTVTSNWSFYDSILTKFGICLPGPMLTHIFQDKDDDTGNLVKNWS